MVTPFSAHRISDHRISDQKVRTVMVWAIVRVRVRVRLGDAVVRNAVGRKVGNLKNSWIKSVWWPQHKYLNKSESHCNLIKTN